MELGDSFFSFYEVCPYSSTVSTFSQLTVFSWYLVIFVIIINLKLLLFLTYFLLDLSCLVFGDRRITKLKHLLTAL